MGLAQVGLGARESMALQYRKCCWNECMRIATSPRQIR